jgi:hypothetical protein
MRQSLCDVETRGGNVCHSFGKCFDGRNPIRELAR